MEPIERASRAEITELQEKLLRETVQRAWEHVPFYRERWEAAGIEPTDIRTLDDFTRLPIVSKTHIDADLIAHPPFGSYQGPVVDQARVARIHASSGTTGDPRPILCTLEDVQRIAKLSARRLRAQGVQPGDLLQVTLPYTLYIGGTIALEGAMELGAGVIPTGTGAMTHSRRQIEIAHRWRPTVLCATPSYALKLADTAAAMNLDPANDFAFRMIYVTAEVLTPELRDEVGQRWNAEVFDNYGSVEAAASTYECNAHSGWHVSEDAYIFETLDRVTDQPVPAGEDGVLVISTLFREAAPFFRYRVGDIVSLDDSPCACGRTFKRMSTVKGRSDEMIKIRGISVYPTAIERVLRSFPELGIDWQLVVDRKISAKDAVVEVEALKGLTYAERTALANRVADQLKQITGVLPEVEIFDLGMLFPNPDDRAKVKTKRVVERASKPRSTPPLWMD
jgi:phenylacetate-CoA ligase